MKKDGGPAFPIPAVMPGTHTGARTSLTINYQPALSGMSLRDYFAAAALKGIIAHNGQFMENSSKEVAIDPTDTTIARWAYEYADAMLVERERS